VGRSLGSLPNGPATRQKPTAVMSLYRQAGTELEYRDDAPTQIPGQVLSPGELNHSLPSSSKSGIQSAILLLVNSSSAARGARFAVFRFDPTTYCSGLCLHRQYLFSCRFRPQVSR